jgi:uncharacterized membrane protein YdjX (TVP38/TMEM64 family)
MRILLLLAAVAAIGATFLLLADGADATLARLADSPMLFALLACLGCAVGIPRQAVAYAASYGFGLWPGVALALLAQLVGCAANLAWARALAREWVARRLAARSGRLARLDAYLTANTFTATLVLRLLPVGNSMALNLLAGASGASAIRFLAGSAIGFLPQTLVFALLGDGTRLDSLDQILLGVALFAASALLGWVLWRRRPAELAAMPHT